MKLFKACNPIYDIQKLYLVFNIGQDSLWIDYSGNGIHNPYLYSIEKL